MLEANKNAILTLFPGTTGIEALDTLHWGKTVIGTNWDVNAGYPENSSFFKLKI